MNPAQLDPLAGYWPGLVLVSIVSVVFFAMMIVGRAGFRISYEKGKGFRLNASAAEPPPSDPKP